jgi:hypothetical protein
MYCHVGRIGCCSVRSWCVVVVVGAWTQGCRLATGNGLVVTVHRTWFAGLRSAAENYYDEDAARVAGSLSGRSVRPRLVGITKPHLVPRREIA